MIDALIGLGFSKNDAAVYSALVEVGPCFVAPLVRQTKKHRQIVYNSLETLMSHQLVSVSEKNGKHFYSITDPQRLLESIKQREVMAESLINTIKQKQKITFCETCGKPR